MLTAAFRSSCIALRLSIDGASRYCTTSLIWPVTP
eukprot:Gb_37575 [translate_table: standard]